jgi:hypothetical protein
MWLACYVINYPELIMTGAANHLRPEHMKQPSLVTQPAPSLRFACAESICTLDEYATYYVCPRLGFYLWFESPRQAWYHPKSPSPVS